MLEKALTVVVLLLIGTASWARQPVTLVHSYDQLMPPRRYFANEPTRYALRGGKHTAGQPCFSNPAVVRTMAESILRLIDAHPDWKHRR